jgi:hypothetical protein
MEASVLLPVNFKIDLYIYSNGTVVAKMYGKYGMKFPPFLHSHLRRTLLGTPP